MELPSLNDNVSALGPHERRFQDTQMALTQLPWVKAALGASDNAMKRRKRVLQASLSARSYKSSKGTKNKENGLFTSRARRRLLNPLSIHYSSSHAAEWREATVSELTQIQRDVDRQMNPHLLEYFRHFSLPTQVSKDQGPQRGKAINSRVSRQKIRKPVDFKLNQESPLPGRVATSRKDSSQSQISFLNNIRNDSMSNNFVNGIRIRPELGAILKTNNVDTRRLSAFTGVFAQMLDVAFNTQTQTTSPPANEAGATFLTTENGIHKSSGKASDNQLGSGSGSIFDSSSESEVEVEIVRHGHVMRQFGNYASYVQDESDQQMMQEIDQEKAKAKARETSPETFESTAEIQLIDQDKSLATSESTTSPVIRRNLIRAIVLADKELPVSLVTVASLDEKENKSENASSSFAEEAFAETKNPTFSQTDTDDLKSHLTGDMKTFNLEDVPSKATIDVHTQQIPAVDDHSIRPEYFAKSGIHTKARAKNRLKIQRQARTRMERLAKENDATKKRLERLKGSGHGLSATGTKLIERDWRWKVDSYSGNSKAVLDQIVATLGPDSELAHLQADRHVQRQKTEQRLSKFHAREDARIRRRIERRRRKIDKERTLLQRELDMRAKQAAKRWKEAEEKEKKEKEARFEAQMNRERQAMLKEMETRIAAEEAELIADEERMESLRLKRQEKERERWQKEAKRRRAIRHARIRYVVGVLATRWREKTRRIVEEREKAAKIKEQRILVLARSLGLLWKENVARRKEMRMRLNEQQLIAQREWELKQELLRHQREQRLRAEEQRKRKLETDANEAAHRAKLVAFAHNRARRINTTSEAGAKTTQDDTQIIWRMNHFSPKDASESESKKNKADKKYGVKSTVVKAAQLRMLRNRKEEKRRRGARCGILTVRLVEARRIIRKELLELSKPSKTEALETHSPLKRRRLQREAKLDRFHFYVSVNYKAANLPTQVGRSELIPPNSTNPQFGNTFWEIPVRNADFQVLRVYIEASRSFSRNEARWRELEKKFQAHKKSLLQIRSRTLAPTHEKEQQVLREEKTKDYAILNMVDPWKDIDVPLHIRAMMRGSVSHKQIHNKGDHSSSTRLLCELRLPIADIRAKVKGHLNGWYPLCDNNGVVRAEVYLQTHLIPTYPDFSRDIPPIILAMRSREKAKARSAALGLSNRRSIHSHKSKRKSKKSKKTKKKKKKKKKNVAEGKKNSEQDLDILVKTTKFLSTDPSTSEDETEQTMKTDEG